MREKLILGCIVAAVFALGLFPAEPLSKTELAARQYQELVASRRTGTSVALRADDAQIVLPHPPPGLPAPTGTTR
jgi:hypothetical protein